MPLFTNEDLDTVVNGSGAAAVNIQDGGNSITVDGTVTATPTGTQDVNIVSTISLPVTGPLTDTQLRATPVPVSGTVTAVQATGTNLHVVTDATSTTAVTGNVTVVQPSGAALHVDVDNFPGVAAVATVTSVTVSTTVATLSASNAAKTQVIVFNEAGTLYVKLGAGATSASYTYRLTANTALEINGYYGIVTAIKQSGTSAALVTEVGI